AEASTTEDPWVRMAAVRAMAKIDPGRTVPYLIPLFSVESDWVRSDAATLAHVLRDERTLPHLEKMLTDKNYEVRFLAAEAIKSIERK
ncbi:MAG TPA: HEAT repeat domain-containing protein, partial [Bacteroidales bacterium]|nr:HEAT repeat domain-containing protein [Bacteroidales bacterium]